MTERRYDLNDLITLMARLRDPVDGCPWDRAQTFATILPFTLEEAYEVADTIERNDLVHLREELGDLLFQVIFYARMGEEAGQFDFSDVVQGIVSKLVRRHPHVFPEGTLESRVVPGQPKSEAEIKASWERIKAEERQAKAGNAPAFVSQLDPVPATMPALVRAEKLQKQAAKVGFDWPDATGVIDKLVEELAELKAELQRGEIDRAALEDEMGDVLFCCVNLARYVHVGADTAMRHANQKFIRRFQWMERALHERGEGMAGKPLAELERLWVAAKADERQA